ncbi:MAG TPA: phosphatase PAP2 family protein [Candidatus Dormibacteraeota bacterium]|nr:phosphatase PAP2 family protein [Candidatus Dormibacteraeota bacterium]HVA11296.1 phosphatase PAP2 family protein [Candidatus Dormibacteraeota bacterium]
MSATTNAPETDQKSAYPTSYVVGFIIGVLLFVPALLIAHAHQLTGLQARIFYDFDNLSNSFKQPALWVTEGLGAGYPIAVCILVPLLFKRFRLAWRFFVTVGGTGVAMEVAKLIAKEPRPVVLLHGQLHLRAIEGGLTSFPSGHEAVATAMALTLWLILPRAWRWLSVLWILIVAVSRLYLGVHTPADIVGGFAIGLMAVCFIRLLPARIAKPLHLDNEAALLERGW